MVGVAPLALGMALSTGQAAVVALKASLRAATAQLADTDTFKAKGAALTKKKQVFTQDKAETKQVPVDEDGSSCSTFTIGANLDPDQEEAPVKFLRTNNDVFAREPKQLAGVPREVIEHHLNVCPNVRPVKQKARRQSTEKQAFIIQETRKLEAAGVIREVRYPEWLANPIVVPKKGGKERMCVDFTNLNKACPQDPFRLPRIDQIVDSTASTMETRSPTSFTIEIVWSTASLSLEMSTCSACRSTAAGNLSFSRATC